MKYLLVYYNAFSSELFIARDEALTQEQSELIMYVDTAHSLLEMTKTDLLETKPWLHKQVPLDPIEKKINVALYELQD